jgi:hypothetical protein
MSWTYCRFHVNLKYIANFWNIYVTQVSTWTTSNFLLQSPLIRYCDFLNCRSAVASGQLLPSVQTLSIIPVVDRQRTTTATTHVVTELFDPESTVTTPVAAVTRLTTTPHRPVARNTASGPFRFPSRAVRCTTRWRSSAATVWYCHVVTASIRGVAARRYTTSAIRFAAAASIAPWYSIKDMATILRAAVTMSSIVRRPLVAGALTVRTIH